MRTPTRNYSPVTVVAAAIIIALAAGAAPPVYGQLQPPPQSDPIEPVDEEELEEFAFVLLDMQALQRELSSDIDKTIAESRLPEEIFYEIYQVAQQLPDGALPDGYTDEELEQYEATLSEVVDAQLAMQSRMYETVVDGGFSPDRYNEIVVAVQQDQELMNDLQRIVTAIYQEMEQEG